MDFSSVQAILNDLPPTFTRPGAPYTQLVDAETGALVAYTLGADGMAAQAASFANAQDGWLDVWGLIAGVPRQDGEANAPYATRIGETLLAWVGTLPALQQWLDLFAPGGQVAENLTGLGYSVTLPGSMTAAQAAAFIATLNRVRPAGVPFSLNGGNNGLFLGTVNFLGEGRTQGAYLSTGASAAAPDLSPMTNNAAPLLPTLYLTDPSLNV